MFRVLGELIVCWVLAGCTLWYVKKKFLNPWQHRRHMSRLEKENAVLDEQLSNIIEIKPREKIQ